MSKNDKRMTKKSHFRISFVYIEVISNEILLFRTLEDVQKKVIEARGISRALPPALDPDPQFRPELQLRRRGEGLFSLNTIVTHPREPQTKKGSDFLIPPWY